MSILKAFGITEELPKPLIAFTDGSCIGNGSAHAKGGFAVVWPHHPEYNQSIPMKQNLHGAITNNRAELYAILQAFQTATEINPEKNKTLEIYSDSKLLVQTMNEWLHTWKQNDWKRADKKPVLNRDLLEQLDRWMSSRYWKISHVRAHTGKNNFEAKWNDLADRLAHKAAHTG
jgi:ribonuclease HI